MLEIGAYRFQEAHSPEELEQVHRLNYQTFVQEIPQHADTGTGHLVDKFHDKNRYLIALKGEAVVGMMCWCDRPPFSIATRLSDPSILEAPGICPVEIRLMAVVPTERMSLVLPGLVWALYQQSKTMPWTHFVISGVVEQREFHAHLGFEPLGPPVGTGRAQFTPMWLPVGKLDETMARPMQLWQKRLDRAQQTA